MKSVKSNFIFLSTQKISWITMLLLNFFFFRFKVIAKENANNLESGPLIIAANHKSLCDHFFIDYSLKFNSPLLPLRIAAADWVFKRWWKIFVILLGSFPVLKGQGLNISLKKPLEILKNNGVVVIYPEGKLVRNSNMIEEPKRGIGALSIWSQAPIMPVAIKGAGTRNIKVIFGKSFFIKDFMTLYNAEPTKEDFEKASKIIMDKIKKLYFSN